MKWTGFSLAISLCLFFSLFNNANGKKMTDAKSVYYFTLKNIDGEDVPLSDYEGKVLLIVNTASECGYTPQYEGLENIYEQYKDKGLVILAFPCNQFGAQEPGNNEAIKKFCSTQYSVTFPLFSKIDVNGESATPLYKHLKSEEVGLSTDDIKWNFTKFLVDRDGKPIKRYESKITPDEVVPDIEKELNK